METPFKRRRLEHNKKPISYQETNVYTTIKLENLDARNRYRRNDSSLTEIIDYDLEETSQQKPIEITRYNQIFKYAYVYERNKKFYIKRVPYKKDLSGTEFEDDDEFKKNDSAEKIEKFSLLGDIERIIYPTKPFITPKIDVYLEICIQRCGIGHNRFF